MLLFVATLALLVGAFLALVLRGNPLRAGLAVTSQVIATALVLAEALPILFGAPPAELLLHWPAPLGDVRLQIEALDAFFLCFSLPMTLLGSIYALGYLKPYMASKRHVGAHFSLLNLTSLSFIIIYTVENSLAFLLGWELAALAAWLLVIWDYENQKIRFAGFNYLVSTHMSFLLLVAAFVIGTGASQTHDLSMMANFLAQDTFQRDVTFIVLMTSFGLKSAFFPFHTWLPRAHSAAPAHVSALMSGVIHKAGLFGMIKFTGMLDHPPAWMGWYVVGFSALSAVMGVLYTVSQRDIKRMLGYSSTENVGIAGIGLGLAYLGLTWQRPLLVVLGLTGCLLHILNHAIFKCLLFYAAGAIYRATHTIDLERLGGLRRVMPWTALFFLVGSLAISALPPFNGFVSEFIIYSGLVSEQVPTALDRGLLLAVMTLLAFVGAVSALAITRAFGIAFLGVPRDPACVAHEEAAAPMRFTMGVHLLGILAVAAVPLGAIGLARVPVADLLRAQGLAAPAPLLAAPAQAFAPVAWMCGGLLLALVLVGLLRRAINRESEAHVTWGCGYTAATPRMQYTGASFASQFGNTFEGVLQYFKRFKLPQGFFPERASIGTHNVDGVENRMFHVLGTAAQTVTRLSERLPETTPHSFAAGFITLVLMVAFLIAGGSL
ncbi:MAG: proton-conducting membrane transporter [Nannocystis sp.]|uniref:proton-conducting transporter transmembrane domain-containing protein n=2 Tax=Nannocystis sp. TaxID=1962667 RepID=UPI0024274A9E|nr:proton-conducting transporter membrane subunit [Nannocystis sp.]MBK9752202.1 proton-conducting membrane transporter [Nannocystis sp.]